MYNAVDAFRNTPSPELLDQFVSKHLSNASAQVRDFVNSWYDDPSSGAYAAEAGDGGVELGHHGVDQPDRRADAHVSTATDKEVELLTRANGQGDDACRLSCSARVQGDLLVFVPEESRAHKQIIRKSAGNRVIDIDAAVRQVYVEVDQPALGEHRGDWRRDFFG